MGSRSFNAWESVERFLDRLPDGRRQWKHKHLPAGPVTMAERQGEKVVGKAWDSKSLFINERPLLPKLLQSWVQQGSRRPAGSSDVARDVRTIVSALLPWLSPPPQK